MFVDLHEDIAYYFLTAADPPAFDVDAEGRQSDLPKLKRAGAELVFASVFPFVNAYGSLSPSLELALDELKAYYSISEKHGVRIVEGRGDLHAPGLKLLLALEGADVLRSVEDLRLFYKLGVRAVGITWNVDNKWGHSCYSKKDKGLTASGQELVEAAQKLGVVVDLAHASKRTALDAIEAAKRPVVISHANAAAVAAHPRNVDDEVLKALADNGGVLGLTLIPKTIGDDPSPRSLARHAKYVKEKFGVEALAIGTDYLGIPAAPPGLESVDKIGRLLDALREVGFTEEEVEAVAWRNAYRVLAEALA